MYFHKVITGACLIKNESMIQKTLLSIVMITFFGAIAFSQTASVKMPDMVHVEGGTFIMGYNSGSSDEQPEHKVSVNNFYIGRF